MKSCAIAIFVKTPGISPLKTRLAATIGRESAETFFKLSTDVLLNTVKDLSSDNPNVAPFWAVAEKEAIDSEHWDSLSRIWQGTGDLGMRLATVYSELKQRFDSVILIGADSPQMPLETLKKAVEYLQTSSYSHQQPSFVIGPAFDGGFYLFGGNASLSSIFWSNIPYSTNSAGSETLSRASEIGAVLQLKAEIDVDTAEDLLRLKSELKKIGHYSSLYQWLDRICDLS